MSFTNTKLRLFILQKLNIYKCIYNHICIKLAIKYLNMENITDLKRVLWHEIGHFCIDVIDLEADNKFSIDEFWVSYHSNAISEHKWGGGVRTIPSIKLDELVEDIDKISFSFISLISGCIFQTFFLKELMQLNIDFKDCFCVQENCAGKSDMKLFHSIASKQRSKYGRKDLFIKFSEIEIIDIYYKIIIEEPVFIENINKLINSLSNKIYNTYQHSKNNDEFSYYLSKKEIFNLKEDIFSIMYESSFFEKIVNLKEMIKEKMTS